MRNFFRTLAVVLSLAGFVPAGAQIYVLDDNFVDSTKVYTIKYNPEKDTEMAGEEVMKLPMGETVTVTRKLKGSNTYACISIDGKEYTVHSSYLLFSDDNPDGIEDTFGNTRERTNHTAMGRFFATMIPYWLIALLFLAAMAYTFVGMKSGRARRVAIVVVPAAILLASVIEISAVWVMGNSAFWWCSPDRYGFWGALWRVIPFVAIVAFQLYSIVLYKQLLTEDDPDRELSLKPMAISLGICLPATVLTAIVLTLAKVPDTVLELLSVAVFLVSLGVGLWMSARRNIAALGRAAGIAFTAFAAVYIIGSIVAIYGLIVVIFQLILQILVVLAAIAGVCFVMGQNSGSGSSQPPRLYYDKSGNAHNSSWDAKEADKKIDQRRAND